MKKKELLDRIVRLESQVATLTHLVNTQYGTQYWRLPNVISTTTSPYQTTWGTGYITNRYGNGKAVDQ